MRIQLRVRTNDLSEDQIQNQMITDGFVLYDNCSEIKFGKGVSAKRESNDKRLLAEVAKLKDHTHAESGERFNEVIFMVRDTDATMKRLLDQSKKEKEQTPTIPLEVLQKNELKRIEEAFHYNVIEWKDRTTNKRYRLVFDTVAFITDDQGNTIRKIEG